MEYYITEESIAYYRESIANAVKTPDVIGDSTRALLKYTQERADLLGPHLFLLTDTLQAIAQAANEAARPAEEVGDILFEIADAYDMIINCDPFKQRKDG